MKHPWSSRAGVLALAVVVGLADTFLLFGSGPLNPANIAWIFGDNATYYAGWGLFRYDPHLHFPLAWTERVGYPAGTSIALLDAIPLAAILLRPLSPLLGEPFQYLGLYSALCFVLQAYFGMSLLRRLFPGNPGFVVLGGLFFLLSPPMTNRALGHTTLLSHWLILAALDSYFRDPGDRPVRWLARLWAVLAISAGINPYMAAMCLLLNLAALARLAVEARCRWPQIAALLAATAGILVVSAATFGLLVASDSSAYWAPGYGQFSMNLNALFNPMSHKSILLPRLRLAHPGQYEGYGYLGLGMLALVVVATVRLAMRSEPVRRLADRRLLPLVGLVLVCTGLATSTIVTFGSHTLLAINLPMAFEGLRASGRLFWPAYYVIVTGALALTFYAWPPRARLVILGAAVALQIADLTPLRREVRAALDNRFASPLQSASWKGLGREVDNLVLVPPFQCDTANGVGGQYSYVWFGKLAVAERLRSNSYYAARYTRAQYYAHCVDLMRGQLVGPLDSRSAYVVSDAVRTIWDLDGIRSHRCQVADGYNLCTPATGSDASSPWPAEIPKAAGYTIGQVLDFSGGASAARPYMAFGWGQPGVNGIWTDGPLAMVRLGMDSVDPARSLTLEIDAHPYLARSHQQVDVDVVVNGRAVASWTFTADPSTTHQRVGIPAALAAERHGLDVELRIRNPEAPLYLGAGPTSALLGLDVGSLVVRGGS